MNAAAKYISFSSVIYNELNYAHGTLVSSGGVMGDTCGEVFAAVDAQGNQFCIAHQTSGSVDDPTKTWAIPCNWMK